MLNDVKFQINIKDLVVDAHELAELVRFLRNKKFVYREYKGMGKGYLGDEYAFELVGYDEKTRLEITPMNDALWLYLNTFGKEIE